MQAELLEKSEEVPLHVLLASLVKDRKNKDRFVNFSYIPIADDELDYIRLLQLFSVIPSDLNSKHLDQACTPKRFQDLLDYSEMLELSVYKSSLRNPHYSLDCLCPHNYLSIVHRVDRYWRLESLSGTG